MCLINISEKKIAENDIIVFKHIEKVPCNKSETKDRYESSYMGTKIVFNKILKSPITIFNNYKITKALHSYISIVDARQQAEYWGEILVECVIPTGSIYYEGITETRNYMDEKIIRRKSFASDTLIYKEILKEYKL